MQKFKTEFDLDELFDTIEDTINRHGGIIRIFDTIDMQLARKP